MCPSTKKREKLRSVKKGATFVESTFNDKWDSGLNKQELRIQKSPPGQVKIYWGKSYRKWRKTSERGKGGISGARQSKSQNPNKT